MCKDKEFKKLKKRVRKLEKTLDIPKYKTPNVIIEEHYIRG